MDINQIGQALLDSINQNQSVQLQSMNQGLRNKFTDINNAANAAGLLYSTRPAAQQAQVVAGNFLPDFAKLQQQTSENTVSVQDALKKATEQIAAMNQAAAELRAL